MDDATLFNGLLRAEDEDTADQVLRRAGYGIDNDAAWHPLGDMPNNRSVVTNQQTEATAAFVEKIINGVDALLMAECLTRGIDPKGTAAPTGMVDAVGKFFGVRDGLLANLLPKEQTELAKRLNVVLVGAKATPSYLVIDTGEGQTPDAFPATFLSLIRENKLGIPFVQGKYNCGGTGALPFCGSHKMQLIVSRRHPKLVRPDDTSGRLWGFTVVRRLRPSATRPQSMYVYLAPSGKVPRFEAETVPVLPEDRSTVAPRPYAVGLSHGTCVKLYNFQWKGGRGIATLEARYELERFLHSPCLPFRLTETRDYKANYFSTTVSGIWATIGSADAPKDSKIEEGFPAYAELNPPGIGPLPYRIAVFRESVDTRHIPHGAFFTVNGQVHGSLPSDFVSRQLKFDYLKDHLLVSIDCTAMDPSVREDFFMASRDRVRKNEFYEDVVERLKAELRDHAGLRQLNASRRKREIENTLSNEEETRNLFKELLKADPALARLFGSGDKLITTAGPGPEQPFNGKKFPTFFGLTKNPTGGLLKACPVNLTCRVEFETDAMNDYFNRQDSPGIVSVEPANIVEHSHLWNGRFNARLRVPWDAKAGDRIPVKVTVEDIQTQGRSAPFVSCLTLIAENEADPRKPGGPSNGARSKPGNGATAPTLGIPKLQWKKFGSPEPSLVLRHDADGNTEYFANEDNTYLTTELVRSKQEDHPLIKFWFGYGLLLCALGMLKHSEAAEEREQKEKEQKEKARGNGSGDGDSTDADDADDLKKISFYCDGIAKVVIPMIRTLYRGPQAVES